MSLDDIEKAIKNYKPTKIGNWQITTIAKDGTTSPRVDLGAEYRDVQVYSPTIDSATLTVMPRRESGNASVQAYMLSGAATGDFANTTTAKTAAAMNYFLLIGARYIVLVTGAAQATAAVTFYVRGITPFS